MGSPDIEEEKATRYVMCNCDARLVRNCLLIKSFKQESTIDWLMN